MKSRRFYNIADGMMTGAIVIGLLSAAGLFVMGAVSFIRWVLE